jgi:hypothetical protein
MSKRPLSSYPPEEAAKRRANMSKVMREAWARREENGLGRIKSLSSYSPEVAAKKRDKMAKVMREAWARREENGLGTRKNGALQEHVQKKISESVKLLWEEGAYESRINGMSGKTKGKHHHWLWGKWNYREILSQYELKRCSFCEENKQKLDVHHVDENHNNYLLSNLIWACVPCHLYYNHYDTRHKQPWLNRSKKFKFEYTKVMKRGGLKSYSGILKVTIKGRTNPEEFVDDFYDVAALVETAVVKKLDHTCLNDHLKNPTLKNLLLWI